MKETDARDKMRYTEWEDEELREAYYRERNQRRRQKRKRQVMMQIAGAAAVVVLAAAGGFWVVNRPETPQNTVSDNGNVDGNTEGNADNAPAEDEEQEAVQTEPKVYNLANITVSDEVKTKLTEMAADNEKVGQILEQADQYPVTLLELLAKNDETVEFIAGYLEKKDSAPAETVGDVTKGIIPELRQWDERWGYTTYGDGMLAINGCGPTVLSMVASGLTGDNTITPAKVAEYSAANGYYEGDAGTSWSLMSEGCYQFGVAGHELNLDESAVLDSLESGHPVVCSMKPGDFTDVGHFIVLTGVEDGKIRLNDSNSEARSDKLWEFSELQDQINNLWSFTEV